MVSGAIIIIIIIISNIISIRPIIVVVDIWHSDAAGEIFEIALILFSLPRIVFYS